MARSRPPSISPPPPKRRRLSQPHASISPPHHSLSVSIPTSTPHTLSTPAPGSLRILSWNVNGIDAFLPARPRNQKAITTFFTPTKTTTHTPLSTESQARRPSLRRCLRRWGWPHVVCLQEVKIARSDTNTQDAVRRMVSKTGNDGDDDSSDGGDASDVDGDDRNGNGEDGNMTFGYDAHFSLPRDTYNARGPRGSGKVYGVCTLVRQDISSALTTSPQDRKDETVTSPYHAQFQAKSSSYDRHVQTKDVSWDLKGRVLVTSVRSPSATYTPASKWKGLIVFNVYAVNGTTNPYHDPANGTITGDRHGHKRRFHTHLARAVRAYEVEGWDVVAAGDLNIARGPNDSYPALRVGEEHVRNRVDFEDKFIKDGDDELAMVDTFRHVHGEERRYTYRPTSKPWDSGMDRVDLILCSRRMIEKTVDDEGNKEGVDQGDKEIGHGWKLVDSDILDSPEERGPSDHVPLFIDIWY